MLFTQIIAFILVMVVFESYQPARPAFSAWECILGILGVMVWLWAGSRLAAAWLLRRLQGTRPPADPSQSARRLITQLQAGAVLGAALIITALDFKAHLISIPIFAQWSTLAGLMAVGLYFALLALVWAAVHPIESLVFNHPLRRGAYMWGQARFCAPVVFPWIAVSFLHDLAAKLWPGGDGWLRSDVGDLFFLAVFLLVMGVFFPPLVRTWWGCRPWPADRSRVIAEEVLRLARVKVQGILSWPVMQGRLLTAGILGIAPRFRYVLLTEALTEALSPMELAGVVAHEAGHVKHRHLVMYLVFFLCFFLAVYALTGPMILCFNALVLWMAGSGWGATFLDGGGPSSAFLSLVLALPLVILLILYLRFVMGYFMRHFERQADLFALEFMGEAAPLAGALEKLAHLSGDTRDMPSWHHFSVAQRVRALERVQANPALAAVHTAMLHKAQAVFFSCLALVIAFGLIITHTGVGDPIQRSLVKRALELQLEKTPHSAGAHLQLGVLKFEDGEEAQGISHLKKAATFATNSPEAINGLAWFLATAKDESLREPKLALKLAQTAVTLLPKPHIWDTLAEAYFVNGMYAKALAAEKSALAANPPNNLEHYQKQLERFQKAAQKADK